MLASWRGRFRWASTALMAQHPAALDNRFSAKREEAQGPPPDASVRLKTNCSSNFPKPAFPIVDSPGQVL